MKRSERLAAAAAALLVLLFLTWLILSLVVIGYYFAMVLPIPASIVTNLLNVI